MVQKPKSVRHKHKLDTNGNNAQQREVKLMLFNKSNQEGQPADQHLSPPVKKEGLHVSKTSPQLQGAWMEKNAFMPVSTPERKGIVGPWPLPI